MVSGYEPSSGYQAGRLSYINLKLNKILVMLKTQQLVPDSFDGECSVSCEAVYNHTEAVMTKVHSAIFKIYHKSFYSNQDINILDEYKSIAPSGNFCGCLCDDLIEVDLTKAYGVAFSQITEIPIFNIYDSFKLYDNQLINKFSLYIVLAKRPNLFLNKTYNIVYCLFLENLEEDVEILYYKEPSFI